MVDQSGFLVVAEEAVMHLRRLIQEFPQLTSPQVVEAVENWQQRVEWRKGELELRASGPKAVERDTLQAAALGLLDDYLLDDVLEMVNQEFTTQLDYFGLLQLVGGDAFQAALRREARELEANAVSREQTAQLWNSLGKPALGGTRWTVHAVTQLLGA